MQHALIIQGGGFRTAFSAGVLDAFMEKKFNPFDLYVAVSGGAIAASYFLSRQPNFCMDSIYFLSEKGRFVNYSNVLRNKPIMNIDVFYDIANTHFPFDDAAAIKNLEGKKFRIVMTNKLTGEACYCDPVQTNWREAVMASCALPFLSKGKQQVNGQDFMDGAWGDPLPVEWTADQGVSEITIVRTSPPEQKISKSWIDFMGEMYYRKNEKLKMAFTRNHELYNKSIDFLCRPPEGITINQIAPESPLRAGEFTKSKKLLEEDYLNGFYSGIAHIESVKNALLRTEKDKLR